MEGPLGAVVFGVVVPALVAASLLTVILRLGRRAELKTRLGLGLAFGVGAGTLAGAFGVFQPSWPPLDVTDRIPFLIALAMIASCLEMSRLGRGRLAWVLRFLLAGLTLAAILGPIYGESWKAPAAGLGGMLLVTGMVLSWINLDAISARVPVSVLLLPLLVVLTGSSVVLVLSGNLVLGRLCGVLTAALAGGWVVSWWVGPVTLERGVSSLVVVALTGLFLVGRFYGELTTGCAVLLALAPALVWLGQLGPLQRRAPWLRALATSFAVLVPVAIAVGLAVAAMPSDQY